MARAAVPVPLSVLAILGLLLGLLQLCGGVLTIGVLVVGRALLASVGLSDVTLVSGSMSMAWVEALLRLPLALVLLVGALGALLGRRWSRRLLLGYALLGGVLGLLGFIRTIGVLVPAFSTHLAQGVPAVAAGLAGGVCASSCGFLYPVVLVLVLQLPSVKHAYAAWSVEV